MYDNSSRKRKIKQRYRRGKQLFLQDCVKHRVRNNKKKTLLILDLSYLDAGNQFKYKSNVDLTLCNKRKYLTMIKKVVELSEKGDLRFNTYNISLVRIYHAFVDN